MENINTSSFSTTTPRPQAAYEDCLQSKILRVVVYVSFALLAVSTVFVVLLSCGVFNKFTVLAAFISIYLFSLSINFATIFFYFSKEPSQRKVFFIAYFVSIAAVFTVYAIAFIYAYNWVFNFLAYVINNYPNIDTNITFVFPEVFNILLVIFTFIESALVVLAFRSNKNITRVWIWDLSCVIMQLISTALILFTTTPYYVLVSLITFYILCFIKNDRQVKVYYVILEKDHVAYLTKKSAIALGYDPNDIKTNPVPKFVEDFQPNRKINFKFFFRGVPLKVITGILTAATTTMLFLFFGSSLSTIDFVGPLILAGVVPAILISMLFWLKESDKKVLYSISYSFLMVFVLLNTSALINSSNNNANFPYLLATISNVLALFAVFAYTFLCGKQKKATLTNIITFSLTALFTLYFTICNFTTMVAFVRELTFVYIGMSIVMPLSLFVLSLSHEDKLYAKSLFW